MPSFMLLFNVVIIGTSCIALSISASRLELVANLRAIINNQDVCTVMPCCYDGLSARIVEAAGFNVTFMTGFGVSATYGLPDTGLASVSEMISSAQTICSSLRNIPCIGDGDTGYGNVANVQRTIKKYAQAGLAGIMIEDQVSPKRCGHTKGKQVVDREEAYRRIKAAVDAREASGEDIVILARTDARATHGLDEAIERCKMFRQLGADWTFLEAPQSEEEMIRYCQEVDGPKMANMLEYGLTPILPPSRLKEIGYSVAAYPLTLLSASARAMRDQLQALLTATAEGKDHVGGSQDGAVAGDSGLLSFEELKDAVGFTEYYETMEEYKLD